LDRLVAEPDGVLLSRYVNVRHKLTANVKFNLYGGGDTNEGRVALVARRGFDDFIVKATPDFLVGGRIEDLAVLKRAIILETFGELLDLLNGAREAGRGTGKGIKAEMQKLMNDADRFDRFNDKDKASIRRMARGLAILVKVRFAHLHKALLRRASKFVR
jgi:hypothetical protein